MYCTSSPCENGGTCEEIENNYQCQCKTGYMGYNCEGKRNILYITKYNSINVVWYLLLKTINGTSFSWLDIALSKLTLNDIIIFATRYEYLYDQM